jgi:hypothetical protein
LHPTGRGGTKQQYLLAEFPEQINMKFSLIALGAATAIACSAASADAGVVLHWTGNYYVPSAYNQNVGWGFTTTAPVDVTALDWYDPTGVNDVQHSVDIWNGDGDVVASACVGSGCEGSSWSAASLYWTTPVTVTLTAGSYIIGGYVAAGDFFELPAQHPLATRPNISIGGGYYVRGGSLAEPEILGDPDPIVGPNFETPGAATVPEPGTWALMLAGLGLLGGMLRRHPFCDV